MNIYMLEKTMELETSRRRANADQLRLAGLAKRADQPEATRTLLHAGRLLIAWTAR